MLVRHRSKCTSTLAAQLARAFVFNQILIHLGAAWLIVSGLDVANVFLLQLKWLLILPGPVVIVKLLLNQDPSTLTKGYQFGQLKGDVGSLFVQVSKLCLASKQCPFLESVGNFSLMVSFLRPYRHCDSIRIGHFMQYRRLIDFYQAIAFFKNIGYNNKI